MKRKIEKFGKICKLFSMEFLYELADIQVYNVYRISYIKILHGQNSVYYYIIFIYYTKYIIHIY